MDAKPNLSDLGNAQRFVAQHGADLRYCYPWGKWLAWDGRRWRMDDTGEVERRAKATVRSMYAEAQALPDAERQALVKHALECERAARVRSMIDLARSELAVLPAALDCDQWLLNCPNGTVDLRTGEARPHDRADLLTKLCPVAYDPDAATFVWDGLFLERVFAADWQLVGFVQRLLGYCLTGSVREQVLPILWGIGANGKSTLLGVMLDLLGGDYAMKAAPDLLMVKGDAHPTERADLHGKRLVVAIETDDGKRLAEALVKDLTGGDRIRARRMREDHWEFAPTHKLILATNHRPTIRGTDHAIWRRIRLVPFNVVIPDDQQDKTLPDRLRGELPGILAWCVQGCLAWQRDGLGLPDDVREATAEYRQHQDVLGAFLNECCLLGDGLRCKASTLYAAYIDWCKATGERPAKQREFGSTMTERGFDRFANNGTWYRGLTVRESANGRTEPYGTSVAYERELPT
ncbi:MAG: phage/plasmid primase, P4 family [Pirellulales bacterium]